MSKKKTERAKLRTHVNGQDGLDVTITGLTLDEQDWVTSQFLDATIRTDGQGFHMTCHDEVTGETAKLDNFPIGIIKLLDCLMHQLEAENGGYGDIHLTIKASAFHSMIVRRPDGQVSEEVILID